MKTNTEAMHTPGPWRHDNGETSTDGICFCGTDEVAIGQIWAGAKSKAEDLANAEFIVRACNSHEELLEAMKTALFAIDQYHGLHRLQCYICDGAKALRAAIAKAEGGK